MECECIYLNADKIKISWFSLAFNSKFKTEINYLKSQCMHVKLRASASHSYMCISLKFKCIRGDTSFKQMMSFHSNTNIQTHFANYFILANVYSQWDFSTFWLFSICAKCVTLVIFEKVKSIHCGIIW